MDTLGTRLASARQALVASGIRDDEAALDVDLFARTILGWDRAHLLTARAGPVPAALDPRFSEWVARRETTREPTAYIVGVREFWGLDFAVNPAVLIPRPETEVVVEEALARIAGARGPRVADIGTGSGCIAVAVAATHTGAQLTASDISAAALVVAHQNVTRHGLSSRVALIETSYLDGVGGSFDLITSNPPYVRAGDKPALAKAVRHEPEVALFGGATGLRHVEGVLDTARQRLRHGGWLVMEFGYGQEDDVRALVATRPDLAVVCIRDDLQGIARAAVIQYGSEGRDR